MLYLNLYFYFDSPPRPEDSGLSPLFLKERGERPLCGRRGIALFIQKHIEFFFKFWQIVVNNLPNYVNINSEIMMGYDVS